MLIQCLATIGALYVINLFVAVVAVAVYLALQYLKHLSGGPGPSLPPTLDTPLLSFGQNGCNPTESLHLVFGVSLATTYIFIAGAFSALLVTGRVSRYPREQPIGDSEQPTLPGYGAC